VHFLNIIHKNRRLARRWQELSSVHQIRQPALTQGDPISPQNRKPGIVSIRLAYHPRLSVRSERQVSSPTTRDHHL
jgi:hypothetical protein